MTFEEFPAAYRDALCDWRVRCGLLPDVETCVGLYPASVHPDLVAAVDAKLVELDPHVAYACIEWLDALGCDPTAADWDSPACFGIYTGTLADGAACAFGRECISGDCFHGGVDCEQACCRGVCAGSMPPALGRIGEQCRFSDCIEGYCDGSVCVAFATEGQPCGGTSQCDHGLSCAGVCTRLPGPGEACFERCRDVGQMCSYDTARCERVRFAGEACVDDSYCASYYSCSLATGKCEPTGGGLGAPCDATFARCTAPYVCDYAAPYGESRCVEPKPDGASCFTGSECASGSCSVGLRTCTSETCI